MPYEVSWYDEEETIIIIRIRQGVTWEMWHQTVDSVVELIQAKPHRVDIINVDLDEVGMPPGYPIPHMKETLDKWDVQPNLGLVVSASDRERSLLVKIVIDVFTRALNLRNSQNGGFVRTIEEAVKRIEEHRAQQVQVTN